MVDWEAVAGILITILLTYIGLKIGYKSGKKHIEKCD